MSANVINSACKNWRELGSVRKTRSGSNRRIIPSDVEEWLVSHLGLEELKFLSLSQRTDVIFQRFKLRISSHCLSDLYRRHGISYRFARPQARHLIANESLDRERFEAAWQLLNLLASKAKVVFIDETTVQSQGRKKKTWMKQANDVIVPQFSVRASVTVYCCVSNVHAGPFFATGTSTNAKEFSAFLDEV